MCLHHSFQSINIAIHCNQGKKTIALNAYNMVTTTYHNTKKQEKLLSLGLANLGIKEG